MLYVYVGSQVVKGSFLWSGALLYLCYRLAVVARDRLRVVGENLIFGKVHGMVNTKNLVNTNESTINEQELIVVFVRERNIAITLGIEASKSGPEDEETLNLCSVFGVDFVRLIMNCCQFENTTRDELNVMRALAMRNYVFGVREVHASSVFCVIVSIFSVGKNVVLVVWVFVFDQKLRVYMKITSGLEKYGTCVS